MTQKPCILPLLLLLATALAPGRGAGAAPGGAVDAAVDAALEGPGYLDWTRSEVERVLDRPWKRLRTPHFQLHVQPGLRVGHEELVGLESSFAALADRLGLDGASRDDLRRRPIDYYHTRNPHLLRRFSEVETEGIAFSAMRIIVSLRLPHEHEVAHVLIHERMRPSPPTTAPLLMEGLASWLAGVGDATPSVVAARGEARLRAGGVDLRSLLTPARFHRSALDVRGRYQCSARFCGYLVDRWGLASVLGIYRLLAADSAEMLRRPTAAVALQLEGWTGLRWDELMEDFDRWRRRNPAGGLRRLAAPDRSPEGRVSVDGHELRWWTASDGALVVGAVSEDLEVDAELLWGPAERRPRAAQSEQPRWRRWGLRLGPTEVHLTDHRRRRRLAVLDSDQRPSDLVLRRALTVRIDPAVLPAAPRVGEVELFVTPVFEVGER